ncbi:hypothetical protein D1P53_002890 [Cryptococcus gattii VGV]|nr:hypothetical protein D1P53_002890 [Cryptococcus gattii VGV]
MSESSVKKRPSTEAGGRDPKRAKHAEAGNGDGDGDNGASAGAGVSSEPDLLKGVEKLYSQVVIRAALIFQYMDYARRIGLKNTKVPVHLQQQLELSWRAYESLRTRIHWDDSKGDRPKALSSTPPLPLPRSVTLATSIPTPPIPPLPLKSSTSASPSTSSSLQALKISAQAPLPIPPHLREKHDGPQSQAHTQTAPFASPIPLGAASSLAFDGQALQEAPPVPPPSLSGTVASSIAIPANGSGGSGGTGTGAGAGAVDFSSLGFNELNQLINGDPTPFGIHLDGTSSASTQINNQNQPQQGQALGLGLGQGQTQEKARGQEGIAQKRAEVIDLTLDDEAADMSKPQSQSQLATQLPAQNQTQTQNQNQKQPKPEPSSLADDVLASLGFSTDLNLTINQDQPPSLPPFTNQGAQNAADGGKGPLDFGLNTEHDFSALAGLFQGSNGTPGAGTGVGFGMGMGLGVGVGMGEGDSNPASNAATAGADDTRPVTDTNPATETDNSNTGAGASAGADTSGIDTTTKPGQQGPAKQEDTFEDLFAAADDIISTMRPEDDIPRPEAESTAETKTAQAEPQAKPQTESQSQSNQTLSNQNQNQNQPQSQSQNQNQNQNTNKNKNKDQTPTTTSTSASIPPTDQTPNFMLGNIGNMGGMDSMGNLTNNLGGMDSLGGIGMGNNMDNLDLNLGSMGGMSMSGMDDFAGMGGMGGMDSNGFGDLGGIDMSDFNFGDAGGDGNGGGAIDTEEFDRLMAEFG